ncbi:J domain-containing protein [Leptolyngbya sp. AN02str]|uniref:J domain-containing protein n=1 Tax=Leptolyngbya sp. AN02str TaxID=3423363 RepID=UPI003D31EA48
MTRPPNYYETLDVRPEATQAEVKQAYRRLAKQFHPDANPDAAGHEQIAQINAAYEVLGDPQRRQRYDQRLQYHSGNAEESTTVADRQARTAEAQEQYRKRKTGHDNDEQVQHWIRRVYQPVNRLLNQILKPLKEQVNALAADPFDDELLEDFQAYLDECRSTLAKAQGVFRSMPNPPSVAGVAAHLYYCLNQTGDGLDELERFVTSYSEHYLHTGQELFRIAKGLQREAQAAIRTIR